MVNCWLFGAKPTTYRLEKKIPQFVGKTDHWVISQHVDSLKRGDKVILWQSGAQAGIYGLGTVAGSAYRKRGESRVDIRYDELLREALYKRKLVKHPVLKNLGVIRMPRGKNPFRVDAAQWEALQKLFGNNSVNIFKSYDSQENQFTNGLVALLELSQRCDGPLSTTAFLRVACGLKLQGKIAGYRVLADYDGHADAELCGRQACVRFKTKIQSGTLDKEQIARHLEGLETAPQKQKVLILLTPDDGQSRYIRKFSSQRAKCQVQHAEWKRVYDYLEANTGRKDTVFAQLVRQYLERIQTRIFEQDFAGVITKIAFNDDTDVDPKTYLDGLKTSGAGDRWNLPTPLKQLDGTHRKLLFYDKTRRGITAEVEIRDMRIDRRSAFPAYYVYARAPLVYPQPIPLEQIRKIPGFEHFGEFQRDRSPFRNITREQYAQLLGRQSAQRSEHAT